MVFFKLVQTKLPKISTFSLTIFVGMSMLKDRLTISDYNSSNNNNDNNNNYNSNNNNNKTWMK